MGFKDTHVGSLKTKVVKLLSKKRKKGKSIKLLTLSNIEQFEC